MAFAHYKTLKYFSVTPKKVGESFITPKKVGKPNWLIEQFHDNIEHELFSELPWNPLHFGVTLEFSTPPHYSRLNSNAHLKME